MKSPIKPPRISNCDAREYVQRREPFIGSNLSATMYAPTDDCHTTRYVVYSYAWWPLYIAETDEDGTTVWYQNEENYSVTTSKQAGQARPVVHTMPMTKGAMMRLAMSGIAGLAALGPVQ